MLASENQETRQMDVTGIVYMLHESLKQGIGLEQVLERESEQGLVQVSEQVSEQGLVQESERVSELESEQELVLSVDRSLREYMDRLAHTV
uniref:Uncharacterized protein n=1 Tax=Anopheles albimanus TaxID=7167 RepID=A0A182FC09_ANOAL